MRLGIDFGDARIGVAACDPAGTLTFGVATVPAGRGDTAALVDLVVEYDAVEVVVGLPRNLAGVEGPAARKIRKRTRWFVDALVESGHRVPVRLVDERMSTVEASRRLSEAGRDTRQQRSVIDREAAAAILGHALDAERATGAPVGEVVSPGVDREANE